MNKTMGGSYHNLAALAEAQFNDARQAANADGAAGGADGAGGAAGGGGAGGGAGAGAGGSSGGAGGAPLALAGGGEAIAGSAASLDSQGGRRARLIVVSNVLPVRQRRVGASWDFDIDEDALVAQAKVRAPLLGGKGRPSGMISVI